MLRPQGYAIIVDPDAQTREFDTITCNHCQKLVFMKPGHTRQAFDAGDKTNPSTAHDPGGFCRQCMQPVCGACADLGTCTPFEKKLEAMEARGRLLASIGI